MKSRPVDILSQRILQRLGEMRKKPSQVSRAIGRGPDYLSDFLSGRKASIGHADLIALATELQTTVPWLEGEADAPKETPAAGWRPPSARTIPVFGLAAGSFNGAEQVMSTDPIDYAPCPPGLATARDAYSLFVSGTSMVPRYFPGDALFIHPHRPVRTQDFVVIQVQAHDGGPVESWVKQLVEVTADEVVTRQFNPAKEIRFKRKYIKAMHRILTPNEMIGL